MVGPALESTLRLVLFGDGRWAADALRRLAHGRHHVVGVVVRERPSDGALVEAAQRLGVPVLRPHDVNDPGFVECLKSLAPALGLSIAYNQILRPAVLESAPLGFLNFHAGKLPFYRGRNVVNWALINGEAEIGVTAHFMDEGIPALVEEGVELVARGGYSVRRQANLPGTYFAGRDPGDEWLDWSDTSVTLRNKIRAISRPAPGARTVVGGQTVIIWRAFFDPAWPKYVAAPGQVVGRDAGGAGVLVKTGDSTLLVQEIEVAGAVGAPAWP